MGFNLKGLMSEIRPRDVAIGTLTRINQKFRDDRKLDEARAGAVYDESLNILKESNEQVNNITTNLKRYNRIAQDFSPEVADFMAQDGVFDLYSDTKDLQANNNLDIQARLYRNKVLQGEYTPSDNPYLADTQSQLLEKLEETKASLKNANNIPENTFAIALQEKKINEQIQKIKSGQVIAPTQTDERQITFTKVKAFPVGTSAQISSEIIYDNIKTAQFLKVNFLDAEEMNRIGLPAVSVEDATKLFGGGNFIPTLNQLEDQYPMFVQDKLIAAKGENPERDVARVIQEYTQLYQANLKTQVEQRIDTLVSPDSITAFLPDRKFAIREKYINDFMLINKVDRKTAISALSTASPDGNYQPDIFLALSQ